jgi:hypothetical protein
MVIESFTVMVIYRLPAATESRLPWCLRVTATVIESHGYGDRESRSRRLRVTMAFRYHGHGDCDNGSAMQARESTAHGDRESMGHVKPEESRLRRESRLRCQRVTVMADRESSAMKPDICHAGDRVNGHGVRESRRSWRLQIFLHGHGARESSLWQAR